MKTLLLVALFTLLAIPLYAGEADVLKVKVSKESGRSFSFSVTLQHADEGWNHYADGWEVVAPDGRILGKRTLYHPHVNEQPFTRSLAGVDVPAGVASVKIRAHDSVHEYGGQVEEVVLP